MADRTDRYFQRLLSDLREIIPELHASVGGSRDCLRGRRWAVNTGYIVHSSLIAVGLLIAGYVLFREPITVNKVIGIVICMIGLYFINK